MAAGPVARSRAQIPLRLCFFLRRYFFRVLTDPFKVGKLSTPWINDEFA